MGPPREPPNCHCLKGGFSVPCSFWKWSSEFSFSLRPKANTVPRSSLVPLFVTTLTTPPTERPNSAL